MPNLAYHISRIKDRVKATREEILETISEIQFHVYSQDMEQATYVDPNTGMPQFFPTIAGVRHYECSPNVRRTLAVFSENMPQGIGRVRPVGPKKEYYFRQKGYNLIPVSTRDAVPGQVATLTFVDDPGDTVTTYYHHFYIQPEELTDESQSLILPQNTHIYLRKAVIELFRTEQYGESGFDMQAIEAVSRKIRIQMNGGYQGKVGKTPIQPEHQIYPDTGYYYGGR